MDFLQSLFEKLLPPMSTVQAWRTTMAMLIFALCVHAAWSMNWLPGLDGFAQNSQVSHIQSQIESNREAWTQSVEEVKQTQDVILARLISSDIESARGSQCKAIAEKNSSGAQGWRVRLDASIYEYRSITKRDYVLRPCDEY